MARFQYETVDTSTLTGLKRAEYLQAHGWRIIRTGLYLIQFEKPLTVAVTVTEKEKED